MLDVDGEPARPLDPREPPVGPAAIGDERRTVDHEALGAPDGVARARGRDRAVLVEGRARARRVVVCDAQAVSRALVADETAARVMAQRAHQGAVDLVAREAAELVPGEGVRRAVAAHVGDEAPGVVVGVALGAAGG